MTAYEPGEWRMEEAKVGIRQGPGLWPGP